MNNFLNKKYKIISIFIVFFLFSSNLFSWVIMYKEEFYKLYHIHYSQDPDNVMENIYWLEKATKADFCNPQYALAKIETKKQWEKYRYLFNMHVNLKLVEQHLRLGRIYDKKVVYFYDAPWKDEYLNDLEKAKACYQSGLYYWKEALLWAEKANKKEFTFLIINEIQNWEDEKTRIFSGKLNYEKTINRELSRVNKNIEEFIAMESKNY